MEKIKLNAISDNAIGATDSDSELIKEYDNNSWRYHVDGYYELPGTYDGDPFIEGPRQMFFFIGSLFTSLITCVALNIPFAPAGFLFVIAIMAAINAWFFGANPVRYRILLTRIPKVNVHTVVSGKWLIRDIRDTISKSFDYDSVEITSARERIYDVLDAADGVDGGKKTAEYVHDKLTQAHDDLLAVMENYQQVEAEKSASKEEMDDSFALDTVKARLGDL